LHAAAAENAVWAYTESDFLNSNCSCDDPCESFSNGQLSGHDFLPLRRYFVGDKDKEKAIVDSVLQPIPCSIASVPSCNTAVFSVSNDVATIANDSGTEYTILTLASASDWQGPAFVSLNFQGAAGSPFLVHGGADLVAWIQDSDGIWVKKNFGKAFVSAHAKLDLMSSHQMQRHKLGTTFDLDGSAYMFDQDGTRFPLKREGGLWKFDMRIDKSPLVGGESVPKAVDMAKRELHVSSGSVCPRECALDMFVPGAFANSCCSRKSGQHLKAFEAASSPCCGVQTVTGGTSSLEALIDEDFEVSGDLTSAQRVANMMSYHCTYNHKSVDVLNNMVRSGKIKDGCILKEIHCSSCDVAKMIRSSKSHKRYARDYPLEPFHTVQGDIFDAEDVTCRNGYRYVLCFICVATGKAWHYNMRNKNEALDGFK